MAKATTPAGDLINIEDCGIFIPNYGIIRLHSLPDISDSKSASYADEPIIGRSFPLKTYSHSENRQVNMTLHLFVRKQGDISDNLLVLRAIESAVYPREGSNGAPFIPPPVCQIKCGELLASEPLCVILKSYSVKFPTDVAWDEDTYVPYKFDIETTWEVVYKSSDLPGQSRILSIGR